MKLSIRASARADLVDGFRFYEGQGEGLGAHFLNTLFSDIEALANSGGVHACKFGFHRALSRRFPFAIFYEVLDDEVQVCAILDCRRRPSWIRRRLKDV